MSYLNGIIKEQIKEFRSKDGAWMQFALGHRPRSIREEWRSIRSFKKKCNKLRGNSRRVSERLIKLNQLLDKLLTGILELK